jgi:hypothetical protein
LGLTPVAVSAGELHTLDGKHFSGDLVKVTDTEITFKTSTGLVSVPTSGVLTLDLQPEPALPNGLKYTDIELVDGTLLHCEKYTLKGKSVGLRLAVSNQAVEVPLASISYLLNDAQDPAIRQDWQEKQLPHRGTQDILAVKVDGAINGIEGTLADAAGADGKIAFEYGSANNKRKKDIDLANAQGVIFQRSPADARPAICKVHDVDRNVYLVAKVELNATGNQLMFESVSGIQFGYALSRIARLDYSNDKVAFLSDLKPAELIEKSRQGRKEVLRLDKNLENGTLELEGQTYAKGLAMHAYTELVYDLDGKYAKFEAVLGMDDQVPGDGKPIVKIEADGKELFAGTVNRRDKRKILSCDVKGARRLRIVVSQDGLFDFGAHVDLANAKLSK